MDEQNEAAGEERRAQATQWFARLQTLPVSKGTLDAFFAWQRDPANAQAFADAERLWTRAGKIGDRPAIMRLAQDAGRPVGTARRWAMLGPYRALALGSCAALLLTASGLFLYFRPSTQSYHTDTGEQQEVALAEGSHVHLNSATRLAVRLGRSTRRVSLDKGEALFAVAHDTKRPFTVTAGDVEVLATGTRFDVRRDDEDIVVTLLEGSVDIRVEGRTLAQLVPGQQWHARAKAAQAVRRVDTRQATAWTQARIVFDATPLSQAVREINRYARTPIKLESRLGSAPISGSFKPDDPRAFIMAVTALLPLRSEPGPNGVFVLRDRNPQEN